MQITRISSGLVLHQRRLRKFLLQIHCSYCPPAGAAAGQQGRPRIKRPTRLQLVLLE